MMYRENDRSSVAGDQSRDEGWQEWPPETTSARFEGELHTAPSQLPKAPAARGSDVSRLPSPAPSAPARNELPPALRSSGARVNDAKPRGRGVKKLALVLAALLAL